MLRCGPGLVGPGVLALLLPCAASAQPPAWRPPTAPGPVALHASYETYAAGLRVAEVDAGFSLGPRDYRMQLGYRTTGLLGLLWHGQQLDSVRGAWNGERPEPDRFVGHGEWRGREFLAELDYSQGRPSVRRLLPADADAREPVPEPLQVGSIDILSALAGLLRVVQDTGRCETAARTFDGRRAVGIEAHTVGEETLAPTARSDFAGTALRCDFVGRMLAGFRVDGDRTREARPLHGSAWLAPVIAGGPKLPVRMAFETRWFGDAVMYLTASGPGADLKLAGRN